MVVVGAICYGPGDELRTTRRLSMQDRAQLRDALARIEILRETSTRQLLVDELADDLGKDFDPPRTNTLSTDCAAIVRTCARLGALPELVVAVELAGASSAEVARLAEMVEKLAPAAVLTSAERRRLADLLARIPPRAVERLFVDAELAEYWDQNIQDAGDAIERLASVSTGDTYAEATLLAFVERAAHQADNFRSNQCHQIIQNAAGRLGREEEIRRLCEQLSDVGVVGDGSFDLSVASSPGDRVVPASEVSIPGEDIVRATAPASVAAEQSVAAYRIIGGIPPQNPSFTGRQEMLKDLRRALRQRGYTALLPHTLHGLGGVGKTQLATEYAHRFQSDYELIWWIPSDHVSSIRRSIVSLARRLELPESEDVDFTVQTVLDELGVGRPSRNWLLVYDNAGNPVDVRRYLPSGPGQVLVTSRNRDWSNESTILEVDVFSEEESIEFLTRGWADISDEDAHMLAEELGRLPLALDQAVAVHRVTGMPLDEYLRLLRNSPGMVLDEGESSDYPQSVAKTCRLAFDRLRERSPGAAQLLEVCAFLSPSEIAVPMLVRGRGAPLPSALAETLFDNIKLRGAIREIGRYALAQLDASRDFIKIHMLVGRLLRDALPPDQRDEMQRNAHALLAFANPQEPDNERTWPLHRQMAPHVIPSGVVHSSDPHVLQVLLDQIRFFYRTGDYRQSSDLAKLAVDEWSNSLGSENSMTLQANFHLGNALRAIGEYQPAREIDETTLRVMKRELGEDHEYTLRAASSHAADLRLLGHFQQALEVDKDTISRYRRILGEDDALTLRAAHNLAVDYRLLGDFGQAYEIDEETLRHRRALLGDNSLSVLASTTSLARDLYGVGEYQKGLEEEESSVRLYESQFKDHEFLLLARRNLAILLRKVGRYAEAARLAADVWDQECSRHGPEHEHSLSAMMTLANALRVCGELEKAHETNDQARKLYRENFRDDHPFTLACTNNLTITLRALGRRAEAAELDRETIDSLRHVLGADHLYTLCGLTNLSNDLSLEGNHTEARKVSQDVYDRSKRTRPEDHPYTLACAANLALDLEATGATDEAAMLRADTRRRLQRKLGREHPETVSMERGRRAECDSEVPPT
jgi:hypothetical protein